MGLLIAFRNWWRRPPDRTEITVSHKTIDGVEQVVMRTSAPASASIVELRNLASKLGASLSGRKFDMSRDALSLRDYMRELEREKLGIKRHGKPVSHIPPETELSIDAKCWEEYRKQSEAEAAEANQPDIVQPNLHAVEGGKGAA